MMNKGIQLQIKVIPCIVSMIFFLASTLQASDEDNRIDDGIQEEVPVIGWVEKVRILPGEMELKAKMDTGAKSSSINVPNSLLFERNGKEWVSFDLVDRKSKKKVKIEKRVHRTAFIKRKGADAHERLVIRLFVCLGREYKEIEMNLADRRGFNYQILIGRSDLAKIFRVNIDPSKKFTRAPHCPIPETQMSEHADQKE